MQNYPCDVCSLIRETQPVYMTLTKVIQVCNTCLEDYQFNPRVVVKDDAE